LNENYISTIENILSLYKEKFREYIVEEIKTLIDKNFIKMFNKKKIDSNKYLIILLVFIFLLLDASRINAFSDNGNLLGKYYFDFTNTAKNWNGPFDKDGIPLRDYKDFGIQYQPVGIAHYALGNWDLYLDTGDTQYRKIFLNMADWFCNNIIVKDIFGVWNYNFDYPRYNLTAPWPSAMSQGEGISVLVRAYQLTGNVRYLEYAKLTLSSFEVPIEKGGVRYLV